MTKDDALKIFKEEMDSMAAEGQFDSNDTVAKREAWNNFTDFLCKDGLITFRQYDTWSQPF